MEEWLGLLGEFCSGLILNGVSGATFLRYSIALLIALTLVSFIGALVTGFQPETPGLVFFLLVEVLLIVGFVKLGRS